MAKTIEEKNQELKTVFTEPMSPEEAGEEILLGPTITCPTCNGEGGEMFQDMLMACDDCRGHGLVYRFKYRQACHVLELPLPVLMTKDSVLQKRIEEVSRLMMEGASHAQGLIQARKAAAKRAQISAHCGRLPSFFPSWAKR